MTNRPLQLLHHKPIGVPTNLLGSSPQRRPSRFSNRKAETRRNLHRLSSTRCQNQREVKASIVFRAFRWKNTIDARHDRQKSTALAVDVITEDRSNPAIVEILQPLTKPSTTNTAEWRRVMIATTDAAAAALSGAGDANVWCSEEEPCLSSS